MTDISVVVFLLVGEDVPVVVIAVVLVCERCLFISHRTAKQ